MTGQKKSERFWVKLARHDCEVPDTSEDFLHRLHPGTGGIAKWFHHYKRCTLISPGHQTKEYFRSKASLTKEKSRHVQTARYNHMIHPFSVMVKWRMVIMFVIYQFVSIMDPLYATFLSSRIYQGESYTAVTVVQVVVNVLVLVNCVLNFFVGYPVSQTREVVLEPRMVAMRYLKTHLFFDLAAASHCLLPLLVESPKIKLFLRQLVVLRWSRLFTVRHYFMGTMYMCRCNKELTECINLFITQVIIMHWCTCYLAVIPTLREIFGAGNEGSWLRSAEKVQGYDIQRHLGFHYLDAFIFCTTHFFAAAHHEYHTRCPYEMAFLSFVVLIGMGYTTYSVAIVTQLFGTVNVSEEKYDDMINQINEYSVSKKLPSQTKYRMAVYYEYKFQRKFFWEQAILNSISEHLRMEVMLYSARHLVEKVHLLKGLSRSAIGTMIALLKQEVFLPGDKLCDTTETRHARTGYNFINYGTMAIYLQNGNVEFGHFDDGDHLGDTGAMWKRQFKIDSYTVAIEISEVYTMSQKDMSYLISVYPDLAEAVRHILNVRKDHLMHVLHADSRYIHQDILTQLRDNKILERGRQR